MDDNKYRYLYEQHKSNQKSRRSKGASTNQWSSSSRCGENEYSYKSPYESYDLENDILEYPDELSCNS
ncbi:hypothetical protein PVK06_025549 [Gossypium arboreum]|uniref:Uncharacterized protein n=1 Tax=Gossypium arboreum TaxID=29729 RepID=A0ABR0PH14_GOSAR|nr:hypothetical protein PVK06_025549 [Gossypium arboreum]